MDAHRRNSNIVFLSIDSDIEMLNFYQANKMVRLQKRLFRRFYQIVPICRLIRPKKSRRNCHFNNGKINKNANKLFKMAAAMKMYLPVCENDYFFMIVFIFFNFFPKQIDFLSSSC